jgi:hypothetical protein
MYVCPQDKVPNAFVGGPGYLAVCVVPVTQSYSRRRHPRDCGQEGWHPLSTEVLKSASQRPTKNLKEINAQPIDNTSAIVQRLLRFLLCSYMVIHSGFVNKKKNTAQSLTVKLSPKIIYCYDNSKLYNRGDSW